MAVAQSSARRGRVSLSISLPTEQVEHVDALADVKFHGNRSHAVEHLVSVHAGRELERARQELEAEQAPRRVVKWKPPTLSMELIGYVAGLVRAGNLVETALEMSGVSPRQKINWMAKGRNDRRDGRESLHATFVAALEQAEAEVEVERIAEIRRHGTSEWRSTAWLLSRQKPQRYAERKVVDGTMKHSVVPLIEYERFTPAELRTLVYLLRKGSPELDDPSVNRGARPAVEFVPEEVLELVEGIGFTEAPALESAGAEPATSPAEAPSLDDGSEASALGEKPGH